MVFTGRLALKLPKRHEMSLNVLLLFKNILVSVLLLNVFVFSKVRRKTFISNVLFCGLIHITPLIFTYIYVHGEKSFPELCAIQY